jgi:MYXO-CTERM domain-containing protein
LSASVTLVAAAHAQSFINLDFDAARFVLPADGFVYEADWSVAAPGWSHGPGQDAGFVAVPNPLPPLPALTASYMLLDPRLSPFGAETGSFAMALHSGRTVASDPQSFTNAYIEQRGLIPAQTTTLQLLSNLGPFSVLIDGQPITIRNVGLDPATHTSAYWFSGDVSAFAGRVVDLRIVDISPDTSAIGVSNDLLVIDEIRLLPISEPPPVALLALGFVALGAWRRRHRD